MARGLDSGHDRGLAVFECSIVVALQGRIHGGLGEVLTS